MTSIRGAVAAMLLAWMAGTAAAQQTGTISGEVTDSRTLRPLVGAQVSIPGSRLGTITNNAGRFQIVGVPAGQVTVRAQMLGYGTVDQSVTVAPGQVATTNFQLSEQALALDEVVVTGSPAGESRRRAIGTSVASIDVSDRVESAPITSVSDILQGSEAGVIGMAASGEVGAAGPMLLRGVTSLTQDNQPLIYIDGVRLDQSNTSLVGSGGQSISRLNDINPQDIERIEVIKGAAATALYGSEASSGVLQIFTKRGRPGETQYNVGVRLGSNWIPKEFPLMHPDPKYPSANDFLDTGMHQEYTASARGGGENITYYVGAGHTDTEGSFVNNHMRRTTARVNLGFNPSERLLATVSSSLGYTEIQMPPNNNTTSGVLTTLFLGNPVTRATPEDPYGGAFIPVPLATSILRLDQTYRYSGSLTLENPMSEVFSQKLTLGVEVVNGRGTANTPYWPETTRPDRPGSRDVNQRTNLQSNIDYGGSLTFRLTPAVESQTSFGGQFFTRRDHRINAGGDDFAGPGFRSLGGTAIPDVGETELNYTTGGIFVQQQVGFNDRLFLIAGVRADGSSAFGEDFGFQVFPKASVSYVISDEPWFSVPTISSLRLRGGYGSAGTQPGAFDAVRMYSPMTAMHGRPGIRANTHGNPNLAPEISQEFEGGFDVGLFEERASLGLTAYHQTTTDVLVDLQFPPSLGILGSQLTNVGKVRNIGFETNASLNLIANPTLQWSVSAGYAYNDNVVLELGAPPITVDRFGTRIVEGYPVSSKWERVIVGTDAAGNPIASDTAVYIGPSIPPHTGNVGTDLSFAGVNMRVLGQFALGHVVNYHLRPYMNINRTGEEYWRVVEANGGNPNATAVNQFVARNRIFGEFIEPADWFKLREVSLSYRIPDALAGRFGASSATLNVAGRNLFTITDYSGVDPEVSSTFGDGNNLSIGADYFTVPPSKQLVFGMNVQF